MSDARGDTAIQLNGIRKSCRGDVETVALADILCRLNGEGCTMVMVTHAPAHAARMGCVAHMLDGRLVDAAGAML